MLPPSSSHCRAGTCSDAAPLGQLSRFLVTLDIELSLYFPLDSFVHPAGKACTDVLMKSLARCDAVFVPGGDGSTQLHPADLFALTQQLHDAVRAVHNDTKFYVSLQQYAHPRHACNACHMHPMCVTLPPGTARATCRTHGPSSSRTHTKASSAAWCTALTRCLLLFHVASRVDVVTVCLRRMCLFKISSLLRPTRTP